MRAAVLTALVATHQAAGYVSPGGALGSRRRLANGLSRRAHVAGARPTKAAVAMSAATGPVDYDARFANIQVVESPLKGLTNDVKRKAPEYLSDITEGFNLKSLSATCFLFFGCLAPAVAFGSLCGVITGGAMGTVEMILSTALAGMVYALTCGQPLTIIGSTGPVLAFIAVLVKMAAAYNLPFLPLYAWTGIWASIYLGIASVFSISNVIEYLTRFTDEIFANLISFIFIYEAFKDLIGLVNNPAVPAAQALVSIMIALGTFTVASTLKGIRKSPLFVKPARGFLSDFAPTLGVVAGCVTAFKARARYPEIVLPCLAVPAQLTTTSGRPWRVALTGLPVWARWGAAIPGMMACILLFFDQNITTHLVNSPNHKLKKNKGDHLDMGVLSIITAALSCFGLPWLCAATVRSINHVKALHTYDESGKITGTIENRVSAFSIHALIGGMVLWFRPVLASVPMPVLTGLFLYLGQSALGGNQMYERGVQLISDPSQDKPSTWTRAKVPRKVVAAFTVVQYAVLGGMIWFKGCPIGVLFPVIIALLGPLRLQLHNFGFSKAHLAALDADEN